MMKQIEIESKELADFLKAAEPISGFDCLEMKRRGQEQIARELEGLGPEEVIEYWQRAHAELLAWQAEAREAAK